MRRKGGKGREVKGGRERTGRKEMNKKKAEGGNAANALRRGQ